ncbi:MAG: hypothetical protein SFW35_11260 [Chitinophagales bacterium]|nr:hypothetical protein [Chitinophagales bacterium]
MELLISFLLAINLLFGYDPEKGIEKEVVIKESQVNKDLINEAYGDVYWEEYGRIFGTDQTEEQ